MKEESVLYENFPGTRSGGSGCMDAPPLTRPYGVLCDPQMRNENWVSTDPLEATLGRGRC